MSRLILARLQNSESNMSAAENVAWQELDRRLAADKVEFYRLPINTQNGLRFFMTNIFHPPVGIQSPHAHQPSWVADDVYHMMGFIDKHQWSQPR